MKNYESPTSEKAGGSGVHLEPQVNIPMAIIDVGLYLEIYLVAAVFYKTLATTT